MSRPASSLLRLTRLAVTLIGTVALGVAPAVAGAAGPGASPTPAPAPAATELTITAPPGYALHPAAVTLRLTTADGAPIPGAVLTVSRVTGTGQTTPVAEVTSDATGAALTDLPRYRTRAANRILATYAGDPTYAAASVAASLPLQRRAGRLSITGPVRVVSGHTATVRLVRRAADGEPVSGPVRLRVRTTGHGWRTLPTVDTDRHGRAVVRIRVTGDLLLAAYAPRLDWVAAGGARLMIAVAPPGRPVVLPAGAPRPRITLPPQPAAVGRAAHPVITPIPDGVWSSMVGRSWHSGCPVGRDGLRLLRINYWGYDGYRHRGEMVAATGAVGQMAGALAEMYRGGYPIRAMYRVDRFGWSARVHGGDDFASMAADNTSAFDCRWVDNRPGVLSPHSYGRALDLDTWENPYRSATGLVPDSWWQAHSDPRVAWRSRSHPVVRIMARHGLRWTYGLADTQHFDAAHRGAGRTVVAPGCRYVVCD